MAEPNENNVRVAVTTEVYCAPIGTTLPTTLASLSAAFRKVGFTDPDALTESLDVTKEILRASQRMNGVRTLTTEVNWTWNFKAMETTDLVLDLFYLGAETVNNAGVVTTTIPATPGVTDKVWVIEEVDGDITTRYVIPRGDITSRGEVPHRGTEGIVYDMTVQVLGTSLSDLGYRITDDPNLAATIAS
jgi:hypothetical protein